MGVAKSFDRLAEPTVCVVGAARELVPVYPPGTHVIELGPDEEPAEPTPIALAVFDARDHAPSVLAELRRSARFASVPALVIAADEDDDALVSIGADDIVSPPLDRSASRRVRTLIELGRRSFALWFAQQALDESASALTIADRAHPDSPIVYATQVFARITGYDVAEAHGRNCRFLQGPDTAPAGRATLRSALVDGRRAQVTLLNYKKCGTPFWNEVTVFPVRTPDGRPLRWVGGVQHDVTAAVEARAEIARLVRQLLRRQNFDQAILNGVEAGIVTTDPRGHVTFVNRCAKNLLGRHDDLEGARVEEVLALPAGPEALLAKHAERRWPHALRVDERELELEVAVSSAQETAEGRLGFFFIFHDRTSEKQVEMERRRFERLAAMGTMVAGFAHEIRNPMASLRSLVESMNEELAESKIHLPHVDRMMSVLNRVETLVRTSLRFGRPSPPRPAAHRPWTILSAAVSSLLPRTQKLGGELCIEADADLPAVYVDETQLVQVLIILLNNALDTTGAPSRVLLRASYGRAPQESGSRKSDTPPPPFVRFDVRDEGVGIPPEIMGRIFDPFFTTKPEGTGLGLSIAQQLVSENAGRIELTSAIGGPTTFSVLVPIAAQSGVEDAVG